MAFVSNWKICPQLTGPKCDISLKVVYDRPIRMYTHTHTHTHRAQSQVSDLSGDSGAELLCLFPAGSDPTSGHKDKKTVNEMELLPSCQCIV